MPKSMAFAAFAAELVGLCAESRAATTAGKMRQVLGEFGSLQGIRSVKDLNTVNVAKYAKSVRDRCGSPATVRGYLSYLSWAATYAKGTQRLSVDPFEVWAGWVRRSPAKDSTPGPRTSKAKHHPREAIARVLAHLAGRASGGGWEDRRLNVLAHLVAYTGVRAKEALRAKAEDVDLGGRVLKIVARHQLKTERAEAPVPIPEKLAAVLAPWLADEAGWMFPGVRRRGPWTGGMHGQRAGDRLVKAGEEVGVAGFTLLSLRHSYSTHAESLWGFSELAVQRVLRHTRPRTQDHYRHADLANLVAMVRPIDYGTPSAAA